jgi:hypothetical protein
MFVGAIDDLTGIDPNSMVGVTGFEPATPYVPNLRTPRPATGVPRVRLSAPSRVAAWQSFEGALKRRPASKMNRLDKCALEVD